MSKNECAVFILLGQSNAVGYDTLMPEEERIVVPMKNVFGLTRENNLSLDSHSLIWTGYTSGGTILGEENDHTYSVSNCLARIWQDEIDRGVTFPDLYIVTIAIGAQGITPSYMWYPRRPERLIPGPLGVADISLCPLANHVFSLLHQSFSQIGLGYDIIGIHWRGGENDMTVPKQELELRLKPLYEELFQGFCQSLGRIPPIILHDIICSERAMDCDPSGEQLKSMIYIDSVFRELAAAHENIALFDVRRAPHYDPNSRQHGIFLSDAVHYTAETNQWVAKMILESYRTSLEYK